jgi:hypothetical protein
LPFGCSEYDLKSWSYDIEASIEDSGTIHSKSMEEFNKYVDLHPDDIGGMMNWLNINILNRGNGRSGMDYNLSSMYERIQCKDIYSYEKSPYRFYRGF